MIKEAEEDYRGVREKMVYVTNGSWQAAVGAPKESAVAREQRGPNVPFDTNHIHPVFMKSNGRRSTVKTPIALVKWTASLRHARVCFTVRDSSKKIAKKSSFWTKTVCVEMIIIISKMLERTQKGTAESVFCTVTFHRGGWGPWGAGLADGCSLHVAGSQGRSFLCVHVGDRMTGNLSEWEPAGQEEMDHAWRPREKMQERKQINSKQAGQICLSLNGRVHRGTWIEGKNRCSNQKTGGFNAMRNVSWAEVKCN